MNQKRIWFTLMNQALIRIYTENVQEHQEEEKSQKNYLDAKLFHFWLKNMLIPKLKPGQIVIMDNASIHKTDATRRLIKEAGCERIFLPPYSPDLNTIEHFLAELKKKLRYIIHQFETLQNAMTAVFS